MREVLGLHAPVQGATDAFKRARLMIGASCVLWTAAEGPQDATDGTMNLVRLPTPQHLENADAYVARTRPQIAAWYASGVPAIFIPGNEPDLEGAYSREGWEATIAPIVTALRSAWTAIKLGSVPYSVANTAWVRGPYLAQFDHICVHSYWPADQPQLMSDDAWGGSWSHVVDYQMPVWITEANSNPVNAAQIGNWLGGLSDRVRGVCFFIADDDGQWPEYNITPEVAGDIRAAYLAVMQNGGAQGPSPVPPPAPDPIPVLPTPTQSGPPPGVPAPSPAPSPDANGMFQRSDYGYQPLSPAQYNAIVQSALYPGFTSSPMSSDVNYGALLQASRARDYDLRLFLAYTWAEDHDETDPGGAGLYPVNNPAGIKWAGQAGAYNSGVAIPANEGSGTYAGFADLGTFFDGWADTLENNYIGPYTAAGDLYSAARKYVNWNDPNAGRSRIDKWMEYRTLYPPEGAASDDSGVTGAMLIAKLRTMIGQPNSDGFDGQAPPNTFHPWAFWCEALAEAITRSFGLPIPRIDSALDHGLLLRSQGRLVQGRPQNGAWMIFDATFGTDGHITFWDDAMDMCLGTVTDGTGIGYSRWNWNTPGFMGSCLPDGVGVREDLLRHDGKADDGSLEWLWKFRKDVETGEPIVINEQSGIYQAWETDLRAGKPWGIVQTNEHDMGDGRILQMFANGICTYIKGTGDIFFN